jgi:Cu2+-exporting ATPase
VSTLALGADQAVATSDRCCRHCGDPLVTDGAEYCCSGCESAAAWIRDAGLDDYYRLRTADGNRIATEISDYLAWDRADVQCGHVTESADGNEITLAVEGLRCAACAWLIDRALMREPGVTAVSVNAVTGRLRLGWRPERTPLSALLQRLSALGYRPHLAGGAALERERRRERNQLLLRLGLAVLATTQAMMFSEALYLDSNGAMPLATRDLFRWLTFLVCTPVVFYSGMPFLTGMVRELRLRRPGMDTLAATSILLAYFASLIETLRGGPHVWFDAAAMFVLFLLSARLLERFARLRASARLDLLARAQPALAWRLREGRAEQVPIHDLEIQDEVWIPADSPVPADGMLLDAQATFDESLLSGESAACGKRAGDTVYAGSVALAQPARLRITGVGTQTRLAQILRLVERAQAQRPALARSADRIAGVFVFAMFALALASFAFWWPQDSGRAFAVALAVLVAACPCALSLAVPAALSAASDALARCGVLVLGPDALARLADVDTVLLDKTGTLTVGQPTLLRVDTLADRHESEVLALAAALERDNRHPLAQAFAGRITIELREQRLHPGLGVEGRHSDHLYRLGRADFACGKVDDGALWLSQDGQALARFELADPPRSDGAAAMTALRALGLKLQVASGDAEPAVRSVCAELGIPEFRARQSPEDKLATIRRLQAQGRRVLMLGDGINDAPVLAGADVSVAMGRGSALAQRAAGVLLLGNGLSALPEAIVLARRTRRVIRQNFGWALAYNLVAVTIAASGWIHPGWAALGMAGSSLGVTLNALRLARTPRARA